MRDYVKSASKRRNLNGDIGINVKYETPVRCNKSVREVDTTILASDSYTLSRYFGLWTQLALVYEQSLSILPVNAIILRYFQERGVLGFA